VHTGKSLVQREFEIMRMVHALRINGFLPRLKYGDFPFCVSDWQKIYLARLTILRYLWFWSNVAG
jgi:hypothetical protein